MNGPKMLWKKNAIFPKLRNMSLFVPVARRKCLVKFRNCVLPVSTERRPEQSLEGARLRYLILNETEGAYPWFRSMRSFPF